MLEADGDGCSRLALKLPGVGGAVLRRIRDRKDFRLCLYYVRKENSLLVLRNRKFEQNSARVLVIWAQVLAVGILTGVQWVNAQSEALEAQLKTATALHQRGDYAHSIPILTKLVRVSPRDYLSNLLLGEDLFRTGKPRDALAPLRVAAEVRLDSVTALDYSVAAAEALGDFATESEALETAVIRSQEDEQHLLAWGNFCLNRYRALQVAMLATRQGQAAERRLEAWGSPEGSEAGESLLEQSAALDPEQHGIWGELGIAQLELGKQVLAQETLKKAEQREPRAAGTLRLEALLAASVQDWQGAEKRLLSLGAESQAELKEALEAWPRAMIPGSEVEGAIWSCLRNPTDSCHLASVAHENSAGLNASELFEEGRWEELAAIPGTAIASQSEWTWRGVALARIGDCPKAIPALERGLTATQREGALYLQECYSNEELRAESWLNAHGKAVSFHELKGDLELTVGNAPAAAEKDYAEALKSRPHDTRLLARSAEACRMSGDQVHARTLALSALAINPQQTEALQTLAKVALYQRDWAEAVVRLKQMAAEQPANPWCKVELGVAYGRLGQAGEAVRYLTPLLTAGYPDPKGELHVQLAGSLRKLGREQEAQQAAAEGSRLANLSLESGAP